MSRWTLSFLLPTLMLCFTTEAFRQNTTQVMEKTIRTQPDITPICTNSTFITHIFCKIKILGNMEECYLSYAHPEDFKQNCSSRFRLMTENHTVFLHLVDLTPVDSGNICCLCSTIEGTSKLKLNITVEGISENEKNHSPTPSIFFLYALTVAAVFIIIPGIIVLFGYKMTHIRQQPQPLSGPNSMEPQIEPYSTFIQRENGLYSTVNLPTS
ncbi:uncharacterized protein LOC115435419 [Sphaeramia orbicularis]|uniref:uncharacterized protein LOC115435419 n=1 Tax=Sphaeramia orbicularis TaxID=375764 RepID=UPI00117FD4B3|nr:uncharacterized protein LOC115435419 [Sphaeramia orbicularis]